MLRKRQKKIMENISPQTKIRFVQKIGKALHQYGATAHHLEGALKVASSKLGLTSEHVSIPTGILSSFESKNHDSSKIIRLSPGGIDLDKLSRVDEVADQVIDRRLSIEEGDYKLDEIEKSKFPYPTWAYIFGYGVAAGGIAICFSGSIYDMVFSFFLGLLVGAMAVWATISEGFGRVFEVVVSFTAAILAAIIEKFVPYMSAELVILSSLIVLVPGLSLVVALVEISTKNLVSGTAKMMGAAAEMMKLVFCAAVGTKIITWILGPSRGYIGAPLPPLYECIAATLAAASFVIIFNTNRRDFFWAMLCALLGYFSAKIGSSLFSPELGFFIGGAMVGAYSNLFAKKLYRPSLIALLPGIILMVPGSLGYRSLVFLFENQLFSSMETAFNTGLIGIAIVIGLYVGNALIAPHRCL